MQLYTYYFKLFLSLMKNLRFQKSWFLIALVKTVMCLITTHFHFSHTSYIFLKYVASYKSTDSGDSPKSTIVARLQIIEAFEQTLHVGKLRYSVADCCAHHLGDSPLGAVEMSDSLEESLRRLPSSSPCLPRASSQQLHTHPCHVSTREPRS